MENINKNKVFIKIFLSFFLLFFLVLIAFAYNENGKNNTKIEAKNKKFMGLVLATSEANMEFLENYLISLRGNRYFLDFITSEKQLPKDNYNLQRVLMKDRNMLGRENIDIGIINFNKDLAIFTEDNYTVENYEKIIGKKLSDIDDQFTQVEGNYLVNYIPYQLSETSDKAMFVLKLRNDFIQRIFHDEEKIDWYIKSEENFIRTKDFEVQEEAPSNINFVPSKGILSGRVYYTRDIDNRAAIFEMFWKLLLALVVVYLISYISAKIIFKITYNPLEEVLEKLEYDNAVNINEYLRLKELLENLQKENILVEKKLEDSNLFLSRKYLKEFIQGILSHHKLIENIGKDHLMLNMKSYQVILIRRITSEKVFMRTSDTLIRSEVEKMMEDTSEKIESLELSHNLTLYITSYDENKNDILEKMISYFQKKYAMKLEIALSGKLREITDVQSEYNTMIKYFEHNLDTDGVITKENIQSMLKRKYYYPLSVEQDLITKLIKGDIQGAKGFVVKVFYENLEERRIGKEEQKTLRILMLNTLRRIRSVLDLDDEKNKRIEAFISKLNLVEDISFEDEYLKAIETIIRSLGRKEKEEEKSDLKERIDDFIRRNYTSEINLQDLADHIGYSQHYMSHVFKGLFKDSFRSKINSYRINKAKEIMVEDRNIKVYELAKRVGYNSSSSFIKIFKNVEGCSPGAYKEKIK